MRRYRMFGLLIAAAVAVFIAPAAAHAEPYPAEPPASSVSDATVSDGATVTFSGKGFLPFEKITINISYEGSDSTAALDEGSTGGFVLASAPLQRRAIEVTATAEGTFSIEIPLTQIGTATLTAVGLTSGVTATQLVTVVAPQDSGAGGNDGDDTTAGGGTLPTTGTSGNRLAFGLYGGLGAVLLGSVLVLATRARRRRTTTP